MNLAQYKPSNTMRADTLEMLSQLPLIDGSTGPTSARGPWLGGPANKGNDEDKREDIEPNAVLECSDATYECLCDNESTCIVRCKSCASALTVPDAVKGLPVRSIATHAFSTCYNLGRVNLPDGITSIGSYAFMNTALVSFDAPPSLRELGSRAFYKCAHLVRATFAEGLEQIGARSGPGLSGNEARCAVVQAPAGAIGRAGRR